MSDDIMFHDSPEKIDKCLSCKRPKCTNCMRKGGKGQSLQKDNIDYDEFVELYEDGWNDPKLADYFGVTVSVIRHYRKTYNLPSKQTVGRGKKKCKTRI